MSEYLEIWRMACCGLKSALKVLDDAGLPAPSTAHIRADGPVGLCCDELTVTPTGTRYEYEDDFNPSCGYVAVHEFEVTFGRCVSNWFGQDKECTVDPGDCSTVTACNGKPWTPPTKCGEKTQADEHALILADRWVLEHRLADVWRCCINDSSCDECPMGCMSIAVTSSEQTGEGGCAGTRIRFELR